MNNRPIASRNLNADNISFVIGQTKPGRNPPINFKYEGQNLQIRLPKTNFPGGVIVRNDEKTGVTSYTLIGSLKGCDPYAKEHSAEEDDVSKFYNFLLDLEEKIIANAVENSVKWFGKKRSEEAIRDGFKRILNISSDKIDGEYVPNGKYPPSFRVKVPVYDNKVSTEIVDSERNPVYATPESLVSIFPKGVEANLVISGSIYVIAGGGFGVTWRLNQAQVFPRARLTAADIFADDEDDGVTSSPAEETQNETPVAEETPAPVQTSRKKRVSAGTSL